MRPSRTRPAVAASELEGRSYLKLKVVVTYEKLWRGDELSAREWTELFHLKVNAPWLQAHLSKMDAKTLCTHRPVVRRLFAECCARLGTSHEPTTRSHAIETLSGLLLGLGSVRFHEFGADVIELLCGLEAVDEVRRFASATTSRYPGCSGPGRTFFTTPGPPRLTQYCCRSLARCWHSCAPCSRVAMARWLQRCRYH